MEQNKFYQIKNITEQEYTLVGCDGSVITRPIQDVDKSASAFTIQDAKDGDVLVASDDSIFLFKDRVYSACKHYVALTTDGAVKFNDGLEHYWETVTAVHPATKEQRDTLERAMHNAGYEWDAIHKQLKKIEQKSATMSLDEAIEHCKEKSCGNNACALEHKQLEKWLTELKELKEQKPAEWSEEDEKIIIELIGIFESAVDGGHVSFPYRLIKDYIRVLKSCLSQSTWKPSDDEMKALAEALSLANNCGEEYAFDLRTLQDQLKKLK